MHLLYRVKWYFSHRLCYRWGATLMNSFLFNVGLILLCSIRFESQELFCLNIVTHDNLSVMLWYETIQLFSFACSLLCFIVMMEASSNLCIHYWTVLLQVQALSTEIVRCLLQIRDCPVLWYFWMFLTRIFLMISENFCCLSGLTSFSLQSPLPQSVGTNL